VRLVGNLKGNVEQLSPTKARCHFVQYMANKPDKSGIKSWLAADGKSKYLLNGFPYLGKDEHQPADTASGLCCSLSYVAVGNKGRNDETDNLHLSNSPQC
jgi:hypothetical protein